MHLIQNADVEVFQSIADNPYMELCPIFGTVSYTNHELSSASGMLTEQIL